MGEQKTCLWSSVILIDFDHGIRQPVLNEKVERIKSSNITIYLTPNRFISPVSVGLLLLKLQLPWSTWPWWGIFYRIQEICYKTTILIISYHLINLRLVPQDYWLVAVFGQNECCRGWWDVQQFHFCCLMFEARTKMLTFCSKWLTIQKEKSGFCASTAPHMRTIIKKMLHLCELVRTSQSIC
jgi:hypothetical protein